MSDADDALMASIRRDNEPFIGTDEQGSAAWLFARVGHVSASRFKDAIGKGAKGQYLAARETYLWELVIERVTGMPSDHWTSAATEWGQKNETPSKMAYEAATGAMLEPVGFVKHPTIKWVGASPDALIGDDGGFESKSPFNSRYHLETLLAKQMPEEHIAQVQGGMWVCSRKYWDFQSFDPRLPEPLNRFCVRVPRDDAYIAELETEIIKFAAEVEARVKELLP